MSIEVEVRSFITKEQYENLLERMSTEGVEQENTSQVTTYFTGEHDLRIQKSDQSAKLILKAGVIHDRAREELEVAISPVEYPKLQRILETIGFGVDITWYRTRHRFTWKDLTICLDDTRGYGYILEIEKMVEGESETQAAEKSLHALLKELDIQLTPRSDFEKAFSEYQSHWRELTSTL